MKTKTFTMKKLSGVLLACAVMASATTVPALAVNSTTPTALTTQSYTWKNVQMYGGGYVDNIIFNPGEEDLIYARTDMGGAYRWDEANQIWIPLTDFIGWEDWNNLGIESLAVDPVNTNRVYMATGTYTNNWTDDNGYIFSSSDYGQTWNQVELPFKNGANMLGRSMGERLVVDPNSPNVLYFGTRGGNGLWKSTDYGATWARVTSMTYVGTYKPTQDDPTMYDDTLTGVVWVTPDPTSSTSGQPCQTIYIGVANRQGENSVFVTYDGGSTWAPLPGQPTTIVVPDSTKPTVTKGLFPHHGVLASNGILYIPYSDGLGPYDGTKGEVWKYDTNTRVWTNISPVAVTSGDDYFGYGGLAVDPEDPNTLIVATLNSWWPDANFFRSTDGGATWTRFWDWNGYPSRTLRYTLDYSKSPWLTFGNNDEPPVPAVKLGWMIGNIAIDPFNSDRMMYGTGATVYGTINLTDIDSGGTVALSVYAQGIEQIAAQDLISPPTGTAHLISGMYDVYGFVHTDLDSVPSTMIGTPYIANTSFDYAEAVPNKYVRVGNPGTGSNPRIALSYSTGTNWYALNNAWTSSSTDTTGGGVVAMSADGDAILWSPNGQPVYYSTNSGSSWALSQGVPQGVEVASDRSNANKFYAYGNGTFYVSTDRGATFTATVTGLPQSGQIKAMHGIEGDIWLIGEAEEDATDVGGLFHSTDSGATFTRINGVDEGSTIGFGMAAPGQSYMALYTAAKINGVRGFFRSDDAGSSWVRINDSQHQYGIANAAITGDPRIYGRVYLATNGRGILYADIAGTIPTIPNSTITPTAAAFDKNTTNQQDITVTVTYNTNTLLAVKNGTTTLVSGTDYTVSGNSVVIKASYLATLATGTAALTFDFSAGADRTLALTISDTTTTTPTDPPVQGDLGVQFISGTTNVTTNGIAPKFRLTNNGTAAISLADIKLRYYFTKEGTASQNFYCDWSTAGSSNVTGTFTDTYLEIGFTAAAGTLAAGQSIEVHSRFAKCDWSNYDQSNDYSFKASGTAFESWDKVTAFQNGTLIFGTQP